MEINVIFKTHFDYGYTDLAENVEKKFMEEYIPNAISTAEALEDSDTPFAWTTGAWLIKRYLQCADETGKARMIRAIEKGQIFWHGLPFTMHVEMMNSDLFEKGLELAKELDRQFGRHTIAAKATDVPGMTRAAVPYLAKAGIKLLHIGVNPVSAVPEVPPVFRWQSPDGSEVIVLYHSTYGELAELPGTDRILYFSMTNDNIGPAGIEKVKETYADLRAKYPGAKIRAISMNEAAELLDQNRAALPVVTSEIGDTWAHGYQSDPGKQSMFRAMLRFAKELPEPEKGQFLEALLPVAEHTCGLCGMVYLHDEENYAKEKFVQVKKNSNYEICEQSWKEQRAYLTEVLKSLPEQYRKKGEALLLERSIPMPDLTGYQSVRLGMVEDAANWDTNAAVRTDQTLALEKFQIAIGYDGAVCRLEKDGIVYADAGHSLFAFQYELFSAAETERFLQQYNREMRVWGLKDYGKLGLEKAGNSHIIAGTAADGLYQKDDTLICLMHSEPFLSESYGCPKRMMLKLRADGDRLYVDFAWWEKTETRIPEALWLNCTTLGDQIRIRKLGEWIDPKDTVQGGSRILHGTDFGVRLETMEIQTLDCALTAMQGSLWEFGKKKEAQIDTIRFNLCNNMWNTNFPMWYGEDGRFRFVIDTGKTLRLSVNAE